MVLTSADFIWMSIPERNQTIEYCNKIESFRCDDQRHVSV